MSIFVKNSARPSLAYRPATEGSGYLLILIILFSGLKSTVVHIVKSCLCTTLNVDAQLLVLFGIIPALSCSSRACLTFFF